MRRVVEHEVEVGSFLVQQVAGVAFSREEFGDGGGGGVGAVCRAERIVDVQVAQACDGFGKALVAGLFLIVEAEVFEQGHIAGFQGGHALFSLCVQHVAEEGDVRAEHFRCLVHNVFQGEFVAGHALRTAQVRHQDGDAALVGDFLHRVDGADDAGGVGHLKLLIQRNIVVHSY